MMLCHKTCTLSLKPPGWNNKSFKLGQGSLWQSSDSKEDNKRELDETLFMASLQYEEHEAGQKSIVEILKGMHSFG